MTIGNVDVVPTAKAIFKEFQEDDLQGLAAEVAYHFLFSIVPLLIFLTALSAFISQAIGINDAMANITDWLFEAMPAASAEALRDPIESALMQEAGGFLSVGAVLALWGAKNAVAALMKALNVAYDVKEGRSWVKRQLVAVGLTLAVGLGVAGVSAFFLFGSAFGEEVAGWLGLGDAWVAVWAVLRWPLILLVIVVALAVLYWKAPDVELPFRWLTPGALVTVVLWAIVTLGLGLYFRFFGGYAEAYGALGGLLAFVFWLYLLNLILLLGGEINAVLVAASGEHPATPEQRDSVPRGT